MDHFCLLNRIDALKHAVVSAETTEAGRDETIEFLEMSLNKLVDYADLVVRQTVNFPLWKLRFDGADRLSRMEDSMYRRNHTHDAAIVTMRALDRLCRSYGVSELFGLPEGDPNMETVRAAAAQRIGVLMEEAYKAGTESSRIGVVHPEDL